MPAPLLCHCAAPARPTRRLLHGLRACSLLPLALTQAWATEPAQGPASAQADEPSPARWAWSGFGTLGAVATDAANAHFHRDGQAASASGQRIDTEVDTNFGLQLDLHPLPGWHAMVQGLAMRRQQQHPDTRLSWAALDWRGPANTTWRVGRMALPVYADSDVRRVGYATPWLRPPGEVYGLALIDTLTGADLRWQGQGAWAGLQLTALAGRSELASVSTLALDVDQVRGVALNWQPEPGLSLRASQVRGQVQLPGTSGDLYRFGSLGLQWTGPRWQARTELVHRRSSVNPGLVNARGGYLMVGRRDGDWLLYGVAARSDPQQHGGSVLSGRQHTLSLGLRWDLAERWALAVQTDRVRVLQTPALSFGNGQSAPTNPTEADGAPPPVPPMAPPAEVAPLPARAITVLGVALSFVF